MIKKVKKSGKKMGQQSVTLKSYWSYEGLFKKHRLGLFRDNIHAHEKKIPKEVRKTAKKNHFFLRKDETREHFFIGEIGFVKKNVLKAGAKFVFEILKGGVLALTLDVKDVSFQKTEAFQSIINQLTDLKFDNVSKDQFNKIKTASE